MPLAGAVDLFIFVRVNNSSGGRRDDGSRYMAVQAQITTDQGHDMTASITIDRARTVNQINTQLKTNARQALFDMYQIDADATSSTVVLFGGAS